MKTKTNLYLIVIIFSISATCLFNDCSLIGFGIGASIDKKKPKTSDYSRNQIDTLEIGARMEISLINGNKKSGKYGGVVYDHNQNFHLKYDSIKNTLDGQVNLPSINDTLLINLASEKNEGNLGIFMGFESGKLWYKHYYSNEFSEIELSLIDNILVNYKYSIDSLQISDFILKQKSPGFIMLKMQIGEIEENIPYDKISSIRVLNKRNAKYIGLGVGLVFDVIIVTAAIMSAQNMSINMSF